MITVPDNSIHPKNRAEWRAWLEQNHTRTQGVWLISYKKGTGKPRFEYDESVEEALCFGWIDSKPNKLDQERSLLWFAPRKRGTGCVLSFINPPELYDPTPNGYTHIVITPPGAKLVYIAGVKEVRIKAVPGLLILKLS